ncbi:low temperature requirement protein A [Cellulomonas sp. McL0617]|uniref:low temperature requirement protein A n=1 Tax=Cellulomonas sp. McL0617 TaxID=3415675 RepID=UPI003CEC0185
MTQAAPGDEPRDEPVGSGSAPDQAVRDNGPGEQATQDAPERHATWKELFFDLVVVAGIGQLAHLLHDDSTGSSLGLYAVLFLAFWITWAGFAVYGDIAGDDARTPVLLVAMVGLAVMAASVPHIQPLADSPATHATAFVVAYVALRWFAGSVWQRGKVVLDWPLAQQGFGAVPWIVSLWVAAPGKYWLWTAGIAIDLGALLMNSAERTLREAQERIDRMRRVGRGRVAGADLTFEGARTDDAHLSERLGLFVIIVLGEGVIQIIDAASELASWDMTTAWTALGAFVLLALVWAVGLQYGVAGIPMLKTGTVAPRLVLLVHAALTGTLAALAVALGQAVEHHGETLPTEVRILLCGAVAIYSAIGVTTALLVGTTARWVLGWGVPSIAVPTLLLFVGADLHVAVLVWLLAATLFWLVLPSARPAGAAGAPLVARRRGPRRDPDLA